MEVDYAFFKTKFGLMFKVYMPNEKRFAEIYLTYPIYNADKTMQSPPKITFGITNTIIASDADAFCHIVELCGKISERILNNTDYDDLISGLTIEQMANHGRHL